METEQSPKDPSGSEAIEVLLEQVDDGVTLVVVDSIGEAFGLDGVNENNDNEVAPWIRRVLRPIAQAGPAVLSIDHSTNANDDPLRPSGSKRKRAAATGHHCAVELVEAFTKDKAGSVRLRCGKDRHGNYAHGQLVANITVVPNDGNMAFEITAPAVVDNEPDKVLELAASKAVWAVHALHDGPVSQNQVITKMRERMKAGSETLRAGIEYATDRGYLIETKGERNARLFATAENILA